MTDYAGIFVGALLGFCLTLLLQSMNWITRRRRSNKILKMEIEHPAKIVRRLLLSSHSLPMAEIPQLELICQTEALLGLNDRRRHLVYQLAYCLKHVENVRQFAAPMLGDLGKSDALIAANKTYIDWLKGAEEAIDELEKELNIGRPVK